MKRPLFRGSIVFLAVTAVFLCVKSFFAAFFLSLLIVLAVWLSWGKKKTLRALAAFSLCGAAAVVSLWLHLFVTGYILAPFYGQDVHGGMVVEEAYSSGSGHFMDGTARLRLPDGREIIRNIRLAEWGAESAQPGEELSFAAICEEREDGFASLSGDLFLTLIQEEDSISPPTFAAELAHLRRSVAVRAQYFLPGEEGYVLTALLTGLRYQIPDSLSNAFRTAGMSHLLVVSGLHLTLAAGAVNAVPALRRREKLAAWVSCVLVWLFALFTGLGVSSVRAAVLTTVPLGASLIERDGDSLTSLALAGVLIALVSPGAVVGASFLLSFSSVLGLMCLSPRITRIFIPHWYQTPPRRRRILCALATSLSAQIGTLPVLAVYFGAFSLSGIIANMIAVPLLLPVLVLGAAVMILIPIRSIIAVPCALLIRLLILIARLAAAVPLAQLGIGEAWQLVWLAGAYAILVFVLVRWEKRPRLRPFVLVLLLAFSSGVFIDTIGARRSITVIIPESGDCVILTHDRHAVILGAPESFAEAEDICTVLGRQNITIIESIFTDDNAIKGCVSVISGNFKTLSIIAPATGANREICPDIGIPLCSLKYGGKLFGLLPVTQGEGGSIYRDGFSVTLSGASRTLPTLAGERAKIRFFIDS